MFVLSTDQLFWLFELMLVLFLGIVLISHGIHKERHK